MQATQTNTASGFKGGNMNTTNGIINKSRTSGKQSSLGKKTEADYAFNGRTWQKVPEECYVDNKEE